MVSVGDTVRPYNRPQHVFEVVETNVDRDVDVDTDSVWRLGWDSDELVLAERADASEAIVVGKRWVNPA